MAPASKPSDSHIALQAALDGNLRLLKSNRPHPSSPSFSPLVSDEPSSLSYLVCVLISFDLLFTYYV
jgi:hypothetical protein